MCRTFCAICFCFSRSFSIRSFYLFFSFIWNDWKRKSMIIFWILIHYFNIFLYWLVHRYISSLFCMIFSVFFSCFFLFYFFVIFYFNFTEENITYSFFPIFPHVLTCISSHGVFYSFYQEFYHFTKSFFTIWFVFR